MLSQDFESILKEVVQAKRLSASKMVKLTEIALKSMEVRLPFRCILHGDVDFRFIISTIHKLSLFCIALTSLSQLRRRYRVSMYLMHCLGLLDIMSTNKV